MEPLRANSLMTWTHQLPHSGYLSKTPPFRLPLIMIRSRAFPMAAATTGLSNPRPTFSSNKNTMTRPWVSCSRERKLPILLFDVMDTIVRDPFYHDVPAFFGMPMKELLACKHPMAWIDFEKGLIDEDELARNFFMDGRDFDLDGLKDCMRSGYSYLDGMQQLLHSLAAHNFDIHAFTNYPIWYNMIEDKLKLSAYLSWTFCSCHFGKRKPDPDFYLQVVRHLRVEPCDCIFIDDRPTNVNCAIEIGMGGLCFQNADSLIKDLSHLGINVSV